MPIKPKHLIAKEALEAAMQELTRLDTQYADIQERGQRIIDAAEAKAADIIAEAKEKARAITAQTRKLQDMFAGFAQ